MHDFERRGSDNGQNAPATGRDATVYHTAWLIKPYFMRGGTKWPSDTCLQRRRWTPT